jgi:uncharacterized protein (TIGR02145 family)
VGTGTINATLRAFGGTLNAKKLDIQTGIGNDYLGWLLARFTYAINSSGGTATFDFRNIPAIPDRNIADASHVMFYMPVLGVDGRIWLNNNLGANYANTTNAAFNPSTQASSAADANAYGFLFQWGRYSDGHEFRTSGSTAGPIGTPWSSNVFLTNSNPPVDWRDPQNDDLWQGESGTNNPCPIGYRLPTETEWATQRNFSNSTGAYNSLLKWTVGGQRQFSATLNAVGTIGYYWTSTVSTTNTQRVRRYNITSTGGGPNNGERAYAYSVRCIRD